MRIVRVNLPANAIDEGNFERVDLTLLSVDEEKLPISVQMRRMPVIVAVPEGTARSRIMFAQFLPSTYRITTASSIPAD